MTGKRFGLTVAAVASAAATIGAGAAITGNAPPWLDALNARGDALNREYGLGEYSKRRELGQPGPAWLTALMARSEELNRRYGLGGHGLRSTGQVAAPDWLTALNARSEALNRRYGLGEYATKR